MNLPFRRISAGGEAESIAKNRPPASDRIHMTDELSARLDELWNGPNAIGEPRPVPADVLISGDIPLQNVELVERDLLVQILIVPGVIDQTGRAGAIFISQNKHPERWGGKEIYATLYIEYDLNALSVDQVLVPEGIKLTKAQGEYLESVVMRSVGDWYGVQIALLHPQIREAFSRPTLTPIRKRNDSRKKKQRVARYIKTHYINPKAIDKAVKDSGPFERKTLCWYVIGHWRNNNNGTKTFINGYWKGPLRRLKRNLDDGRERIVAV